MAIEMSEMPECKKLSKRTVEWNIIFPFLEWLSENNMCIAVWNSKKDVGNDHYLLENPRPIGQSPESLLYKYFQIDVNKLEQERRKILESLRNVRKFKEVPEI